LLALFSIVSWMRRLILSMALLGTEETICGYVQVSSVRCPGLVMGSLGTLTLSVTVLTVYVGS